MLQAQAVTPIPMGPAFSKRIAFWLPHIYEALAPTQGAGPTRAAAQAWCTSTPAQRISVVMEEVSYAQLPLTTSMLPSLLAPTATALFRAPKWLSLKIAISLSFSPSLMPATHREASDKTSAIAALRAAHNLTILTNLVSSAILARLAVRDFREPCTL